MARSMDSLNRARGKVNREVIRFVVHNGELVVGHRELELVSWKYLSGDGVHLNAIGIDMWCLGLPNGVRRALRVWRSAQT